MNINKDFCRLVLTYFLILGIGLYIYYNYLVGPLEKLYAMVISAILRAHGFRATVDGSSIILLYKNKVYKFSLIPGCTALDVSLFFASALMLVDTKNKIKKWLLIVLFFIFVFVFNILRIIDTIYFLTVSKKILILTHQIIFRTIDFIIIPIMYMTWYIWMKK